MLDGIGQKGLQTFKDQALNERHYGSLQGLDKDAGQSINSIPDITRVSADERCSEEGVWRGAGSHLEEELRYSPSRR